VLLSDVMSLEEEKSLANLILELDLQVEEVSLDTILNLNIKVKL